MDLNKLVGSCTVCLSDKETNCRDHMFLYQNSAQEYQTDLEVILEFLEEHYRQESGAKSLQSNAAARDLCAMPTTRAVETSEVKPRTGEHFSHATEQLTAPVAQQPVKTNSSNSYTDFGTHSQALDLHNDLNGPIFNAPKGPERPLTQNTTPEKTTKPLAGITPAEKGKKLRLFHFLFEVLEDPKMAHCVSWVAASAGVFRFSARHKERVAELWGQRKGNRMPMTYQKMSRALRNYVRSGEIIKVKKKLTYQFGIATLITLKSQHIKNDHCVSK